MTGEGPGSTGGSWVGSRPQAHAAAARRDLRRWWGIDGELRALPSERDQNFLVGPAKDRPAVVFKIANLAEDPALLACQEMAMDRLRAAGVPVARPVPTLDGRTIVDLGDPGPPWARVLTWLDGTPLASLDEPNDALLADLGATMGRSASALLDMRDPAADRAFQWDVTRSQGVVREGLPAVADPDRRALLAGALRAIEGRLVPLFPSLRASIIHNDANDHNVLVDAAASRVRGLLDFGDMCHSLTAHEAAVAATYAMFHRTDPMTVIGPLVGAFDGECPLTDPELEALPDLILARVSASLAISARQGALHPDPYLRVSEAPGWQLLAWLDNVPVGDLHSAVHAAVGR